MRKVYIETTVVSYYTGRPSRDLLIAARQEATHELWPRLSSEFQTYISAVVHDEASGGDAQESDKRLKALGAFGVLHIAPEARALGRALVEGKAIPEEHPEDALHIAVAAVNGMDFLLTWNFAHINNPFTRLMIRQIVENAGYRCPEICSPEDFLEAKP
ncbi:MAG: type II toxin-antitoxin system VapC family toxin [Planctomycetes bacterium]|nr:type II toxin-antitoxin system VapC family toxin [Planctomycetota bacterium]